MVPGRRQILMNKILVTAMALGAVAKERFAMARISSGMSQMTIDLRAAAASARAFADGSNSAELKRSFYAMARRWDAEAELRESELAQDQELPRTGRH